MCGAHLAANHEKKHKSTCVLSGDGHDHNDDHDCSKPSELKTKWPSRAGSELDQYEQRRRKR